MDLKTLCLSSFFWCRGVTMKKKNDRSRQTMMGENWNWKKKKLLLELAQATKSKNKMRCTVKNIGRHVWHFLLGFLISTKIREDPRRSCINCFSATSISEQSRLKWFWLHTGLWTEAGVRDWRVKRLGSCNTTRRVRSQGDFSAGLPPC